MSRRKRRKIKKEQQRLSKAEKDKKMEKVFFAVAGSFKLNQHNYVKHLKEDQRITYIGNFYSSCLYEFARVDLDDPETPIEETDAFLLEDGSRCINLDVFETTKFYLEDQIDYLFDCEEHFVTRNSVNQKLLTYRVLKPSPFGKIWIYFIRADHPSFDIIDEDSWENFVETKKILKNV